MRVRTFLVAVGDDGTVGVKGGAGSRWNTLMPPNYPGQKARTTGRKAQAKRAFILDGVHMHVSFIGALQTDSPAVPAGSGGVVDEPREGRVVHGIPDGEDHVAGVEMAVADLP